VFERGKEERKRRRIYVDAVRDRITERSSPLLASVYQALSY
jgi:hypothetical protein